MLCAVSGSFDGQLYIYDLYHRDVGYVATPRTAVFIVNCLDFMRLLTNFVVKIAALST